MSSCYKTCDHSCDSDANRAKQQRHNGRVRIRAAPTQLVDLIAMVALPTFLVNSENAVLHFRHLSTFSKAGG